MAPRAIWKGWLTIAELSCPVKLFAAASTSERIAFHTINRATGHRVRREFVDAETGKPVEREDQVKGYEVAPDDYVQFEPEELAAVLPEGDGRLAVAAFVPCDAVETLYLDKPYYLAPAEQGAEEAFVLIREGLKAEKAAALARAVMFRRVRTLLIRPSGPGLIAETLNFDYEVRSADEAFADVPKVKLQGEMLDLARHIIDTRRGRFDPAGFDDRYEAAVAALVAAKLAGKPLPKPKPRAEPEVIDLMQALRESARAGGAGRKAGAGRRKAGGTARAGDGRKAG